MYKKNYLILFILILLCICVNNMFTQEIELYIGGELYVRNLPTTIEEANKLILDIVSIQNNSDKTIMELKKDEEESTIILNNKINELNKYIIDIEKELTEVTCEYEDFKKKALSMNKMNTNFSLLFNIGPVFSLSRNIGTSLNMMGVWRIFSNIHLGIFCGLDAFSNMSDINGKCGLTLGYSFY